MRVSGFVNRVLIHFKSSRDFFIKRLSFIKNTSLIVVLLLLARGTLFANSFEEGFDPGEARVLIALCNSYTFLKVYGSDAIMIPKDYKRVYTSEIMGLDNVFQVYESKNAGVINFRGSTEQFSSWVENFYSAMIPGEGVIKIDSIEYNYAFASDTDAAVHAGYALAVVLLSPLLIEQINNLNAKGIDHIYITGHSQGGALALLARAYFENLPENTISPDNVFKTYTFANPMCGNEAFAKEYEANHSQKNMSYTIINPDDFVPKMPTHYEEEKNLYGTLFYKGWVSGSNLSVQRLTGLVQQLFEPVVKPYIYQSNRLIEKIIATSYVDVEMPGYNFEVNYFKIGQIVALEPFPKLKTSVDISNMTEKEIAKLEQDKTGIYYKVSTSQHEPYQYYVAILRKYFPEDYKNLELIQIPGISH